MTKKQLTKLNIYVADQKDQYFDNIIFGVFVDGLSAVLKDLSLHKIRDLFLQFHFFLEN